LLSAACSGTTTQGADREKREDQPSAEATPDGAVSTGSGGTSGSNRANRNARASGGTEMAPPSGGSAGSSSQVPDVSAPGPTDASCPTAVRPTVFAEPAKIVGMQIALTATDVYWNDGSGIVRQSKGGGPPERLVAVGGDAARIAASAERLFWEAGGDVVSTTIAAPDTGAPVAQRMLTGNWAVGGDQLYYLFDPRSGVGGSSGFDPSEPSSIEATPISGDTKRISVALTAPESLGPLTADATGAYWAYNQRNDPAAYVGSGGGPSAGSSSRIQKLTYLNGKVSDFAPVGVIAFGNLQSDGDWVVWADTDPQGSKTTVYGAKPDGSLRESVHQTAIVRGLAVFGSTVYWAASRPGDDNSDIWTAELGVKNSARRVACEIPYVYGLKADATDLYYFTWLANPTINRIPNSAP